VSGRGGASPARRAGRTGAGPAPLGAVRGPAAAALALALSLAAAQAVAAQSAAPGATAPIANSQDTAHASVSTLRGLDTLNGETRDLTLAVGETASFGHLEITLEACRVPREAPESDAYAFLSIRDIRESQPRFSGWMFASSPALSALDHPRYDVWVLSCSSS
jgi:hypothetical protein